MGVNDRSSEDGTSRSIVKFDKGEWLRGESSGQVEFELVELAQSAIVSVAVSSIGVLTRGEAVGGGVCCCCCISSTFTNLLSRSLLSFIGQIGISGGIDDMSLSIGSLLIFGSSAPK